MGGKFIDAIKTGEMGKGFGMLEGVGVRICNVTLAVQWIGIIRENESRGGKCWSANMCR